MSKIEWTEQTWNPVRGTGDVLCVPEKLEEPLRWRKPRRVFVNSMSDLFHEDLPDEFIAAVFGVMAACPQHTFQVLTKRPGWAVEWFRWIGGLADRERPIAGAPSRVRACLSAAFDTLGGERSIALAHRSQLDNSWRQEDEREAWPLPNVWIGVSVEDQQRAEERIPLLLQIPAVVRFLSCEPLLGPIDFGRCKAWDVFDSFLTGIGWVIVGGESGTGARPCHLAWVRSIVDQCRAAGVPCFVKQLGTGAYDLAGDSLNDDGTVPVGAYLDGLHPKAGDPSEWPEDLRVREYPT